MLSIIFWVFSALVLAVSMGLCIWLGYRRGVFNSAMRLGFFVVSGLVAFLVAKLLVKPIGFALSDLLVSLIGEDIAVLTSMTSLQGLIVKLGGGLLAPLVFMVLFFVIDKLTFFAYVPLKKKFADDETLHAVPHDKLFGAILGGVLALAITISCVLPVGGYPTLLDETVDRITASSLAEEMGDEMAESVDEAADLTIVKVDYALSGWLFRGLTSDARSVISTSFSLLGLVDSFQNADDAWAVSAALQELPDESFELLISVTKDVVTQIVPSDESYSMIIDTLLKALDQLPDMRSKLSSEKYVKELEAMAGLASMLSDPSAYTEEEIIKATLSSSVLTSVVLENRDELKEELSDVSSELTDKEKKEIKKALGEHADELGVDDEVVSSLLSILGIS